MAGERRGHRAGGRRAFGLLGPADREADDLRCQQDVSEHDENEQRKDALIEGAGLEQDEKEGDLRHPLRHQPRGQDQRRVQARQVGADESAGKLSQHRDEQQGDDGLWRQADEGEIQMQAGRGEEEGNEQAFRGAARSPDREAPKSSAPSDPCSPISSAPTTTRKRPPINSPNESSGTSTRRCRMVMASPSAAPCRTTPWRRCRGWTTTGSRRHRAPW